MTHVELDWYDYRCDNHNGWIEHRMKQHTASRESCPHNDFY